ncbi:MAG: hypothetical protein QOJ85_3886 [Solirubrobacteraceae bacterium]|nr:hypothetical protein [Solirubrobacteraceae bacterium]
MLAVASARGESRDRAARGPATHDVAHRQDPDDLRAVQDDDVTTARGDHLLGRALQRPVGGRVESSCADRWSPTSRRRDPGRHRSISAGTAPARRPLPSSLRCGVRGRRDDWAVDVDPSFDPTSGAAPVAPVELGRGLMRTAARPMRTVRQTRQPLRRYLASHACTTWRETPISTATSLTRAPSSTAITARYRCSDNRQRHQCQSRPPAPKRKSRPRPPASTIT